MKRRTSRSLVPQRMQVPIAIGGSIVFALMLTWRIQQFSTRTESTAKPAAASTTQPAEVKAKAKAPEKRAGAALVQVAAAETPPSGLAQMLERYAVEPAAERGGMRPGMTPARDPFDLPTILLERETAPADQIIEIDAALADAPVPVDWAARAQAVPLKAICLTASGPAALIDGKLLREGDKTGDFTVSRIEEGGVTLTDAQAGQHALKLKGPVL
jgi:hypothetical protein